MIVFQDCMQTGVTTLTVVKQGGFNIGQNTCLAIGYIGIPPLREDLACSLVPSFGTNPDRFNPLAARRTPNRRVGALGIADDIVVKAFVSVGYTPTIQQAETTMPVSLGFFGEL